MELEPDNHEYIRFLKNIKKSGTMKDEASGLFKEGKMEAAVQKFQECLEIDPLNVTYNSTILMNLSIGLSKLKKNNEALAALNKCIACNPDYAKAYVKRAEVNKALENYNEVVIDL